MTEILINYESSDEKDFNGFISIQKRQEILPSTTVLINSGVSLEIPVGYEGTIFRSFSLIPFEIPNLPGTIDSDYRKEIKILIYNPNTYPIILEAKEKIAYIKINQFVSLGDNSTSESAGTDLKSSENFQIHSWKLIKLQWTPSAKSNLHFQYRSRSGLALNGFKTQYTSDIKDPHIMVYSENEFQILKGNRIVQVVASFIDRKTITFFPLNYYKFENGEEIISFDTRLKNCIIEFQTPNIQNASVKIFNNPSFGGIVILKIISNNGGCFLDGLFAKVFFYSPIHIKWKKGQIKPSERGSFGSTGI